MIFEENNVIYSIFSQLVNLLFTLEIDNKGDVHVTFLNLLQDDDCKLVEIT